MNKILFSLLTLCVSINGFSQKFSSTIKPLPNEKWYGAFTAKAYCNTPLKDITFQPYAANEKKKDFVATKLHPY
jgi:alpha-glucosidase